MGRMITPVQPLMKWIISRKLYLAMIMPIISSSLLSLLYMAIYFKTTLSLTKDKCYIIPILIGQCFIFMM